MVQAPDNKRPSSSVPQAGKQKDDDEVQKCAPPTDPIATKGDVEIVFHPVAQGDVPAPPELCETLGDIWEVEILREAESEHSAQP